LSIEDAIASTYPTGEGKMKRAFAIALTGVGLAAVVGLLASTGFAGLSAASAQYTQYNAPAHASGPAQDWLYGGGRYGGATTDGPVPFFVPLREFSIDAHANPTGSGAYGSLAIGNPNNGNLTLGGEVTCLEVAGNSAVAGGFVRDGLPANVGLVFFVYFESFGQAGSGTLDRSTANFLEQPDSPNLPKGFPKECTPVDNNAFGLGYVPFTAGDVVIHDE
jgi:hypothetical protein